MVSSLTAVVLRALPIVMPALRVLARLSRHASGQPMFARDAPNPAPRQRSRLAEPGERVSTGSRRAA
ncbi:hypothetical protein [Neoroseomonas rubea]|uniref:hypothetical protein n=1 Tax=Neoroseomonas rubea TaxID=2748666 RepID=UPI0018DF41A0|nr:hypothetical protein [Roseomonas rubea]